MIKTSTDIGVTVALIVSWSELLLLSDTAVVITVPYLVAIVTIGLTILIVSYFQIGAQYSSFAKPKEANILIQKGFYQQIRHPIYLGFFIVCTAFLLSNITLQVFLAYALILLITNFRADLEEGMLETIHPEYAAYKERTKRYIPYIY